MKPLSVTLERNIPLMRRQNTDIAWNGMMLRADAMLLYADVTLLPIHTCTRLCYITMLHYMSIPTLYYTYIPFKLYTNYFQISLKLYLKFSTTIPICWKLKNTWSNQFKGYQLWYYTTKGGENPSLEKIVRKIKKLQESLNYTIYPPKHCLKFSRTTNVCWKLGNIRSYRFEGY